MGAVLILRYTRPEAPRPYRTWGYPAVPLVFLAFYVFLLGSMFWARPFDRLIGLALIAGGVIVYAIWGERQSASTLQTEPNRSASSDS